MVLDFVVDIRKGRFENDNREISIKYIKLFKQGLD